MSIFWAYFEHIWAYFELSWAYLGDIFGIAWIYLGHIVAILKKSINLNTLSFKGLTFTPSMIA